MDKLIEIVASFGNAIYVLVSSVLQNSESIKNFAQAFFAVVGGVCAIKGLNWLKGLQEKKAGVIFGVWSQLAVNFTVLKKRLAESPGLLNCLYSEDIFRQWRNTSAPPEKDAIDEFYKIVAETFSYIKSTSDQLPSYQGWTEDYSKIVNFLDDILCCSQSSSVCIFRESQTAEARDDYAKEICDVLSNLINGIETAQKSAEQELCK